MKKLISASAVCALAVGLVAAPSALGVKGPKQVDGTVSANVTPNPLPNATTTVTANGNVAASSNCRKSRTVHFAWVDSTTHAVLTPPIAQTATTGNNGDYTASGLPRPTATAPATSSVELQATVDQVTVRVVGKKHGRHNKRGRQFTCMSLTGYSAPVTLTP